VETLNGRVKEQSDEIEELKRQLAQKSQPVMADNSGHEAQLIAKEKHIRDMIAQAKVDMEAQRVKNKKDMDAPLIEAQNQVSSYKEKVESMKGTDEKQRIQLDELAANVCMPLLLLLSLPPSPSPSLSLSLPLSLSHWVLLLIRACVRVWDENAKQIVQLNHQLSLSEQETKTKADELVRLNEEMKSFINNAQRELEEAKAELQNRQQIEAKMQKEFDDHQCLHHQSVRDEIAKAEAKAEAKVMGKIREEETREVQQLLSKHANEHREWEAKHKKTIDDLKAAHAAELAAGQNKDNDSKTKAYTDLLNQTRQEAATATATLTADHQRQMEELKDQHQHEIKQLKQQHAQALQNTGE
jgi:hypothetical protein